MNSGAPQFSNFHVSAIPSLRSLWIDGASQCDLLSLSTRAVPPPLWLKDGKTWRAAEPEEGASGE